MVNILDQSTRVKIINAIKNDENKKRKALSLAELEIYNDNITPFVKTYLSQFYSQETLKESPMISCVNVCRKVVNQEASIYKERPVRTFTNVSPEVEDFLHNLYEQIGLDSKLLKSNQYYKLQRQNHIQLLPIKGKIKARVLLNHQIDAVPMAEMPEVADVYIISGYDKGENGYTPKLNPASDNMDQVVADSEDYKPSVDRYAWWSGDLNFITDSKGNILSGLEKSDVENPLGIPSIVEVSDDKDLEYWARQGSAVADFTVQFNAALTDLSQIVRMQGFSIAWFKGAKGTIPQNLIVGLNHVLRLEIDPSNPVDTDFGFASPSPDLSGSIQYIEMLLSCFLSSRGIDPNTVSGKAQSEKFGSGIERLLSMLEKFEASKVDMSIYERVEKQLFELIKKMINVYVPSKILDYEISSIPQNAGIEVKFVRPEMVQTESDKMLSIEKRLELGLISQVEAIAEDRGVSIEDAEKIYQAVMPAPQPITVKINPEV